MIKCSNLCPILFDYFILSNFLRIAVLFVCNKQALEIKVRKITPIF